MNNEKKILLNTCNYYHSNNHDFKDIEIDYNESECIILIIKKMVYYFFHLIKQIDLSNNYEQDKVLSIRNNLLNDNISKVVLIRFSFDIR